VTGGTALVHNVLEVRSGIKPEHGGPELRYAAFGARAVIDFTGARFQVGDELFQRCRRNRRIHGEYRLVVVDVRERREVLERIVRQAADEQMV
jgi:hypothetical protein